MRNGMRFNGFSEYVDVPNSTSLNLPNTFTVEVEVFITTTSIDQVFISKGSSFGGSTNYCLGVHAGLFYFDFYTSPSKRNTVNRSITPDMMNRPLPVTITYDGVNACIYTDGTLKNSGSVSGPLLTNAFDLFLGKAANGNFFGGSMYFARVYNRALSWQEVAANYQFGMATNRAGLVGEWLTDGTANDTSGNGNNGTIYGARLLVGQAVSVQQAPIQKNLLPPFSQWTIPNSVNVTSKINTPYSASMNVTNGNQVMASPYIPVTPNTTYTYSAWASSGGRLVVLYYDSAKNFLSSTYNFGNFTFTTTGNCQYVIVRLDNNSVPGSYSFQNPQLEVGGQATAFATYNAVPLLSRPANVLQTQSVQAIQ